MSEVVKSTEMGQAINELFFRKRRAKDVFESKQHKQGLQWTTSVEKRGDRFNNRVVDVIENGNTKNQVKHHFGEFVRRNIRTVLRAKDARLNAQLCHES